MQYVIGMVIAGLFAVAVAKVTTEPITAAMNDASAAIAAAR